MISCVQNYNVISTKYMYVCVYTGIWKDIPCISGYKIIICKRTCCVAIVNVNNAVRNLVQWEASHVRLFKDSRGLPNISKHF